MEVCSRRRGTRSTPARACCGGSCPPAPCWTAPRPTTPHPPRGARGAPWAPGDGAQQRPGPMAPGSCAGYSVLLTGHSLGAGVAVLASMLIDRGGAGDIDARDFALPVGTVVRCDAFAPPPVFTPLQAVSASINRQVRVVVNAFDLIPRLSVWSAVRLCEDMARVHDLVADRTVLGRLLLIWRPLWFPGARAAGSLRRCAGARPRGPRLGRRSRAKRPRRGGLRRGESWIRMADRAATGRLLPPTGEPPSRPPTRGPSTGPLRATGRRGRPDARRRLEAFGGRPRWC